MKFVPTVSLDTAPVESVRALNRGQWVKQGDTKGILIGVTKGGSIVVAWAERLAAHAHPAEYMESLSRYVASTYTAAPMAPQRRTMWGSIASVAERVLMLLLAVGEGTMGALLASILLALALAFGYLGWEAFSRGMPLVVGLGIASAAVMVLTSGVVIKMAYEQTRDLLIEALV